MAILKDAEGNEVDVFSKEELKAELGTMITGAIRGQLPKIQPIDEVVARVTEKLGLDAKLTALGETLSEHLSEKFAAAQKQTPAPGGQTAPELRVEDAPAFKAMKLEQDKLRAQLERAESEKKAERDKARGQLRRQATTDALSECGITGFGNKAAFNHLLAEGRIVHENDSGDDLLFVSEKGDRLPLRDGIKAWAESEEAKTFLPPRGAAGSGADASRSATLKTGKRSPFDIPRSEIGRALGEVAYGDGDIG